MNNLRPRASKVGLISLCPGSHQLSAAVPDAYALKESDAAAMGTTLHACMAAVEPYEHGVAFGLPDYELGLITRAIDWEDSTVRTFIAGHPGGNHSTEAEHAFPPIALDGVPQDLHPTGHADRMVWNDEHGLIIDYKFGRAPLEREILAPQLLTYAAAMLDEYPRLLAVEVVAYHTIEDAEYYEVVNRSDLVAIKGRLAAIILATQEKAPLFVPGRLQCQHCPASGVCDVAHREMRQLVRLAGRSLAEKSPEDRARFADMCKLVRGLADTGLDAVKGQLQIAPGSIPGWRLKERQVRVIENQRGAVMALTELIETEDFLDTCRLSITKLEGVFVEQHAKLHGVTKKDAKAVFAMLIEPFLGRETTYILERDTNGKALPAPEKESP
jgi:hypothetical protein